MRYRIGAVTTLGLAVLATGALAEPTDGPYVTGAAGGSYLTGPDGTVRPVGAPGLGAGSTYNLGPAGSGAVGWGFGNGLRSELQVGILYNDIDHVAGRPGGKGYALQYPILGNLIYDYDVVPDELSAHLGAGIGVDPERIGHVHPAGGLYDQFDEHGAPFAYQLMAGVETPVVDGIRLGVEYRFLGTSEITYSVPTGTAHDIMMNHGVMLTLRYAFGTEAPPPPPPPAPQPQAPAPAPEAPRPEVQRAYQVFFDFDKSEITAAAAKVVRAAAESVREGNLTRITVTGHTDTVGGARYNQALSERRAAAVKRELERDGVPGDEIVTRGVGKTGLLVPTADGVREPQNRRAEIILE